MDYQYVHSLESSLQHQHTLTQTKPTLLGKKRSLGLIFCCVFPPSVALSPAQMQSLIATEWITAAVAFNQKNPPKLNFIGVYSSWTCGKNVKVKVLMSMLQNSGYLLPRTTWLMYKKNYCHFWDEIVKRWLC